MKVKTKLKEIDREIWRFIIYETSKGDWVGDFVYSPISAVDLSMLILLNENEKSKAKANRNYLIELSESIRNNFKEYLKRSLNRDNYEFLKLQKK